MIDNKKMNDVLKIRKEGKKAKKELELTTIEAEVNGLVISISGDLKITKVEFEDDFIIGDKEALEKAIFEASNKWLKKAQEVATAKMGNVMKLIRQ